MTTSSTPAEWSRRLAAALNAPYFNIPPSATLVEARQKVAERNHLRLAAIASREPDDLLAATQTLMSRAESTINAR